MGCQGSKDNKAATAMNRPTPRHEITEAEPAPEGPDLRPDCEHMWYWEEDKDRLDRHHTWDKKGNFVAYPPRVSEYIEAEYQGRKTSMNTALEINYKCYNEHTGFNYRVDFSKMCQINAQSNYERKIMRHPNPNYRPASLHSHAAKPVPVGAPALDSFTPPPLTVPPQYALGADTELYSQLKTMTLYAFKEMIKGGSIDLDAESSAGGTLLTWAAEYHRVDIVEALLAAGADIRKKDSSNNLTALEWATNSSYPVEYAPANRNATIAVLSARTNG